MNLILRNNIAFSSVMGSRAYGLERPESDTDRRGFYVLPANAHWSARTNSDFRKQIEFSQQGGDNAVYWEVGRFLEMLVSNNPNMLETLFSPVVEICSDLAKPLIDQRERFLSKRIIKTYRGYAIQQFEKLRANKEACEELGLKPKTYTNPGCVEGTRDIALSRRNAMHMVRMMIGGVSALRDHCVQVDVREYRDELLAIRAGTMSLKGAHAWFQELQAEFDALAETTTLRDRPDAEWADQYLVSVRQAMARDALEQESLYFEKRFGSSVLDARPGNYHQWMQETFGTMAGFLTDDQLEFAPR